MAQLSIPQSLIGALIDIADLGTLDYFPPTERCAHWSLYDAQHQELLCPCAPAANATTEKLFEAAAKILYENFPRYIDSPEEIIPYTSRQELVAALRRGDDELSDEEQTTKVTADSTADVEVEPNPTESAVIEDAEVSASVAPKPAAPKPAQSVAGTEQVSAEELPVLSHAAPIATVPKPAAPKPGAPKPAAPTPSAPAAEPVAAAPRAITAEDRERPYPYRLRPSLRARLERENISEELVRAILREGKAERINDWTIRFTHDDYRVDVNTASAEVITVIDEYDADYNEAAQTSLAQGEYTSLNALELEFSERARTFLKKNPPFVFDLMLQTLSSPESVRMAEGWTRIYAAQGLEIAISPDERTVMALAKTADFHNLHAETLRKVQLEELSNTLAKQAEDKAARADTTEEEK